MALYFSAARSISWASRMHRHASNRLQLPHNLRYKSTYSSDIPNNKSKIYTFMTKSRTGIGSFATLCGHAASICTVVAYCDTDMLGLRSLAMSGGLLGISFQYYRPQPLWIPIKWGCLFLCINGYMVAQLLLDRHRANHMPPELQKIYDDGSFDEKGFSKVQFMKFFNQARRTVFLRQEMITQEGRKMDKL